MPSNYAKAAKVLETKYVRDRNWILTGSVIKRSAGSGHIFT